MKKKLLLASVLMVPVISVGGFWAYQAHRFESSIEQDIVSMQEALKILGISFSYDSVKVSKLAFKAHLVNPVISGVLPEIEAVKDLKGIASVKGEVVVCYSPFSNTISLQQIGETHLKAEGARELEISFPKTSNSSIIIQRKEYDFFGKNPFLSIQNIKGICTKSNNATAFLNGQKVFEVKKGTSDLSLDQKLKNLDLTVTTDFQQMQIFYVEKPIRSLNGAFEVLNRQISNELMAQEALGLQDQKLSFLFHVDDVDSYVANIKTLLVSGDNSKEDPGKFIEDINKIFPVGMRFNIKEFSSKNKVVLSSLTGNFERTLAQCTLGLVIDVKFEDEWKNYWDTYEKKLKADFSAMATSGELKAIYPQLSSVLESKKFYKDLMPQLQTFGNMNLQLTLEAPTTGPIGNGKGSFHFKSGLYDIGIKGSLTPEGSLVNLTTRNASAVMADLENYVTRITDNFSQAEGITSVKDLLKKAAIVLNKVMEPQATSEQHVDIQMNHEGFKVGKYDVSEILALFNEGLPTLGGDSKGEVKVPADGLPLPNPTS